MREDKVVKKKKKEFKVVEIDLKNKRLH